MSKKSVRNILRRAGEPDADFNVFTEAALAAQDGKKVPLTLEIGGPVVGEATLHYDPGEKALMAEYQVDDPKVAEILREDPPSIFG
jgi:hypothetical protein